MKIFLRKLRDTPLVLSCMVWLLRLARRFGLFASARYYRHVPYRGLVEVQLTPVHSFRTISSGNHIENALYWEGTYVHEVVSMRMWIERARDSKVVLDVGANSGVFALAAAAMGATQVHAFEPLPRIYDILRENFATNSFTSLNAWQYAISDKPGVEELFDPGGDVPTSASLSSQFSSSHFNDELPRIKVPVTSIDAFCMERGIGHVDLIKIDVEGHEEFALRGMVETVMRCRPVIFLEVLDEYDAQLRSVVRELFGSDYCWERIDEGNEYPSNNVLLSPLPQGIHVGVAL